MVVSQNIDNVVGMVEFSNWSESRPYSALVWEIIVWLREGIVRAPAGRSQTFYHKYIFMAVRFPPSFSQMYTERMCGINARKY